MEQSLLSGRRKQPSRVKQRVFIRKRCIACASFLLATSILGAVFTSPFMTSHLLGRSSSYTQADADGVLAALDSYVLAAGAAWGALGVVSVFGLGLVFVDEARLPLPDLAVRIYALLAAGGGVACAGVVVAPLVGAYADAEDQAERIWSSAPLGIGVHIVLATLALGMGALASWSGWCLAVFIALSEKNSVDVTAILNPPISPQGSSLPQGSAPGSAADRSGLSRMPMGPGKSAGPPGGAREQRGIAIPRPDPVSPTLAEMSLGGHRSGLDQTAPIDVPSYGHPGSHLSYSFDTSGSGIRTDTYTRTGTSWRT